MAKWTIPEPLPFDWEMRDLSSARNNVQDDGNLPHVLPDLYARYA